MSKIEYLDPEIANEGQRADEAFVVPKRPHVWDYAQLKEHEHYGKYFAQKPFRAFPAWIYNHKTGESKIVGDEATAAQYGVSYNTASRFHHYECAGDWMDEPPKNVKADVHIAGKSLVTASATQAANTTADTMAQILHKLVSGNAAPQSGSPADNEYAEFLEFKQWKASQAHKEKLAVIPEGTPTPEMAHVEPKAVLTEAEQKEILVNLAKEKEIHVDKRWSLDRIKSELDKAA